MFEYAQQQMRTPGAYDAETIKGVTSPQKASWTMLRLPDELDS